MTTQSHTSHSILSRLSLPLNKEISLEFDGGNVTSDAGLLLLAELDARIGLLDVMVSCIKDKRQQGKIAHTIKEMVQQRVFLICCGYEDCNDSQTLRKDPTLKIAAGKRPEFGDDLSSQPTLSRFENSITTKELLAIGKTLLEHFIRSQGNKKVTRIVLDFDVTDDPTHGSQQLSLFHGYYDCYCYLPLFVFATINEERQQRLIASVLRPADTHPGKKTRGIVSRIVRRLKRAFPGATIIFRADSGFALPELYEWCEQEAITYVISLPKNERLLAQALPWRSSSSLIYQMTRQKAQCYGQFHYAAKTWSHPRRVIVKAEYLRKGENSRFLVTNAEAWTPLEMYRFYRQRGDVENRIEELKNHLKSDRTSCTSFLANQFRLFLHSMAFVLIQELKGVLEGTVLERAETLTIRLKLLKIGARIKESVRRIWIHCASSFPLQQLFWEVWHRIRMRYSATMGSL